MNKFPGLAHDYCQDSWQMWVEIGGERAYAYFDVSPFHRRKFMAKLRRNRGKAMDWLGKHFPFCKCRWGSFPMLRPDNLVQPSSR